MRSIAAQVGNSLVVPQSGLTPQPDRPAGGRRTFRVGLVGCGAFARFSMAQYSRLPDVSVGAVADIDASAARRAAAELKTESRAPGEILVAPDIDLFYIATPPAMHHRQAAAALLAGRHVLVEKPLATTLSDAEELASLAAQRGLVCVANLVERYNPLAHAVGRLIDSRILGDLVHGLFINEAADEGLGRDHWFWNRDVSGGIFVEHGVHFFDLVASWLGQGTVVSAARSVRPELGSAADDAGSHGPASERAPARALSRTPVEEQVVCTCRYRCDASQPHAGVLVHFEHGFHQPSRIERQEMRLVFERGELRLFDWVPTHGDVRALVDDDSIGVLESLLPAASVRTIGRYEAEGRRVRGRFQDFEATELVEVTFGLGLDKLDLYGQVVRDLAADQIAWIHDPGHLRSLTEADSVAAVAMATAADRLALGGG